MWNDWRPVRPAPAPADRGLHHRSVRLTLLRAGRVASDSRFLRRLDLYKSRGGKQAMRCSWLAATLCFYATLAAAQYKWIDNAGRVGFGDKPPPGAHAIEP